MAASSKRALVFDQSSTAAGESSQSNDLMIGNGVYDLKQLGKFGKVDGVSSFEYQEAVKLSADSPSHMPREAPCVEYDSDELSKVNILLGNGKIADILLWRDEKSSFLCFLLISLVYYSIFIAERTFISSLALLLLLSTVLLYGNCILPLSIYGFTIDRLSPSYFVISEVDVRNCFLNMRSSCNRLNHLIKLLAEGEDWSALLKVSAFIYLCKLLVLNSLCFAIGTAISISFTLFFVYDEYEEEIDCAAAIFLKRTKYAIFLCEKNLPPPLVSALSRLKTLWVKIINQQTSS